MDDSARGREDFDMLRRLERLEERQIAILERMTETAALLANMNDDVKAVVAEVGGAPDSNVRGERDTLRWRIHRLEGDAHAAEYAKQLLEESRDATATAKAVNQSAKERQWSLTQKVILLLFAGIGALGTLYNILGLGPS